jgi:hypothetical protein
MKKILSIALLVIACSLQAGAQHQHMKGMDMKMDHEPKKPAKKKAAAKPAPAVKKPVPAPAKPQESMHGHDMHNMGMSPKTEADTIAPKHNMDNMSMDDMDEDTTMAMEGMERSAMGAMSHALSLNLPMSRDGSGTSWSPDNAPMYMYMKHAGKWMYMLHGNFFIRYNYQDITRKGYRGDERWDAPNMLMAMGQRQIGAKGLFHFGAMFSLDALFTGQRGYPLLFQSGESANGLPLVDRQHPHDLFSALEVSYAYSFNKKSDAYIYLGYPGEPALGATTFMHRSSGMDNPDAPLSHHWVDATHITFGVATLGYRYGKFKIEGSSFTGREPDENRYDFDKPRFDSRSARLWFNSSSAWSMQVSHGFIKSPEALHADEDVYRTTASASYSKPFGVERFFNATGLWGMNKQKGHDGEHAALLEGSLRMQRLVLYTRYEWVQKSVEELNLDEAVYGHDAIFPVNTITIGAGYDVLHNSPVRMSLGAQGSLYAADKRLDALYGKNPLAAEVYLRFYPRIMNGKM